MAPRQLYAAAHRSHPRCAHLSRAAETLHQSCTVSKHFASVPIRFSLWAVRLQPIIKVTGRALKGQAGSVSSFFYLSVMSPCAR